MNGQFVLQLGQKVYDLRLVAFHVHLQAFQHACRAKGRVIRLLHHVAAVGCEAVHHKEHGALRHHGICGHHPDKAEGVRVHGLLTYREVVRLTVRIFIVDTDLET